MKFDAREDFEYEIKYLIKESIIGGERLRNKCQTKQLLDFKECIVNT